MKRTPLFILSIYMICAFTCVTFAWMSAPKSPTSDKAVLEFDESDNVLTAQDRTVSYSVYGYDETLEQYVDLDQLDSLAEYNGFYPRKNLKIRFDFKNTADSVSHVKLQATDITLGSGTDSSLLDYLYFGISTVEGYDENTYCQTPTGTYVSFSNSCTCLDNVYTSTLIETLYLTPTTGDNVISLYGYILFSRLADSTYEGKTFSLGHFRIIL